MSTLQDLKLWNEGVEILLRGDAEQALSNLLSMTDQTARTRFNIAQAYERLGKHDDALEALSDALSLDDHLVIAYFQRGCILFKLKRYQEALDDFEAGYKKQRGREFIDYRQLGMRYRLQNAAFVANQTICKQMLQHTNKQAGQLLTLPDKLVFQPPKNKIANMQKMDFLGKAKVIIALDSNDTFPGFSGIKKQEAAKKIAMTHSAPSSPTKSNDDDMNPGPSGVRVLTHTTMLLSPQVPSKFRSRTPPAQWSPHSHTERVLPTVPPRPKHLSSKAGVQSPTFNIQHSVVLPWGQPLHSDKYMADRTSGETSSLSEVDVEQPPNDIWQLAAHSPVSSQSASSSLNQQAPSAPNGHQSDGYAGVIPVITRKAPSPPVMARPVVVEQRQRSSPSKPAETGTSVERGATEHQADLGPRSHPAQKSAQITKGINSQMIHL